MDDTERKIRERDKSGQPCKGAARSGAHRAGVSHGREGVRRRCVCVYMIHVRRIGGLSPLQNAGVYIIHVQHKCAPTTHNLETGVCVNQACTIHSCQFSRQPAAAAGEGGGSDREEVVLDDVQVLDEVQRLGLQPPPPSPPAASAAERRCRPATAARL